MTPFRWTADHIAQIDAGKAQFAPCIPPRLARVLPGYDLWDHWPVLNADGSLALIADGLLVIALSAPILPDPEQRHSVARLRLLHFGPDGWRDLGPCLPEGLSDGSREWAGCALMDPRRERLALHFTAAGHRGEPVISFDQRLFCTTAELQVTEGAIRLAGWTDPVETLKPDGSVYQSDLAGGGAIGSIKAFRDPFVFVDAASGVEHMVFSASSAEQPTPWNGLVGLAQRSADGWALQPPLVDAAGLNNELERPHVVRNRGLTYLFWSTQAKVFADADRAGPTGLYGVVADTIAGPWQAINGSGLVIANPFSAPAQAYSWQVLPDLSVWSFADLIGLSRSPVDAREARTHFGGTPAPVLRLRLDGDRAALV